MLVLALPVWAAADSNKQEILTPPPASAATAGQYEFILEKGADEQICRDFLANLKKIQPSETALACEVKLDPDMKQFGLPDWKGLGIKEYWDIAYDIEKRISYFFYSNKEATKEKWLKDYTEKTRSGELSPRLRQARVKLAAGAPELTVFGYTRHNNNIDACKMNVGQGNPPSAPSGELIFIHDKARSTLAEIIPSLNSESFFKSRVEHHVITYNSNLFFLGSQPVTGGYDIEIFGMDTVTSTTGSGKKMLNFAARLFCNISARNTPAPKP